MGQHVDVAASRPREEPFQIAEPVEYFLTSSRAMFSASWTGSVAYHAGQDIGQLVWADRNGNEVGTIGSPSDYQPFSARLSPDDSALLVARKRPGLGFDIWRMNLNLGPVTEQLVTSNRGSEVSPVWIDDRTIVFAGDSPGSLPHLFRKDLATGNEEQLLSPGWQQASMDVFSNGTVAYVERGSGGFRLFQLPSGRGASPTLLLPGPLSVTHMHLSPDERAMTFISGQNEGRMDVHVSTVSVTNAAQLVAAGVSGPARWSRDENRIYYLSLDGITMMTVAVRTVPSLKVYKPEQLFKLRRQARLQDVFRDGRFLLLVPQVRADEHPITVWTAAIPSRRR
jgi:hypothetical protein